jgi:hypothetical protein
MVRRANQSGPDIISAQGGEQVGGRHASGKPLGESLRSRNVCVACHSQRAFGYGRRPFVADQSAAYNCKFHLFEEPVFEP